MKKLLAFYFLALGFTGFASAAVFEADWQAAGDGLLTRDTGTGLEFLDLSIANGMSYLDVTAQLASGGQFDGFRVASIDEVVSLMNNFGLPFVDPNGQQVYSGDDAARLTEFILLTGATNPDIPEECCFSQGMTSVAWPNQSDVQRASLFWARDGEFFANFGSGWLDTDEVPVLSTWLVRSAPVPLPAALPLMVFGVGCLIGLWRRA